ncbi:LexA family protein [Streptomyces ochraceiscleroticus]|uniref:LexA family protein n=1 Tax=Streptomyces ochraceiscleroticus TaxID=47761 RepID=A0ABW1MUK4_9ACTN|nr:winged helix-turn-helix transcriptional regulator [Streptomyces ochraceiscleroticus]
MPSAGGSPGARAELRRRVREGTAWAGGEGREGDAREQERVARAAQDFVVEHGEAPSVRELAGVVGLSASTVAYHLRRLRDRGVNVRGRRPSGRCPTAGDEHRLDQRARCAAPRMLPFGRE